MNFTIMSISNYGLKPIEVLVKATSFTLIVCSSAVVVVLHLISARERLYEVQVPHLQSTINKSVDK
jgi:hypothetical protein